MAGELGELLRSRRERLRPTDVGLPVAGRRRTPGLRREEVAGLAGVSVTYYTVLEQGRSGSAPSRQVLDALAGALRLSAAERDHLHVLATRTAAESTPDREIVSDAVCDLVERLAPGPAYVTGRRWDVLASNAAARELFADWTVGEANLLRWMLLDPSARHVYVEWEKEASAQLARYRAAAARRPGDPADRALLDALRRDSPDACAWWTRHEVAGLSSGAKLLRHPRFGEIRLRYVVLLVADAPDQKVVAFDPPPSPSPG